MQKILSAILCGLVIFGLFTGCDRDADTAVTDAPAINFPRATEAPGETTVPETQVTYPPATLNTTVVLEGADAPSIDYVLIPVSQNAPFSSQEVQINEAGADALIQWLTAADSRDFMENFGLEEYGEAPFTLPAEAPLFEEEVPPVTGTVRLAVDEFLADSGLLDERIAAFEEAYSCTVEILSDSTIFLALAGRSGHADLLLVESCSMAQSLVADGYSRILPGCDTAQLPLVSIDLLLCGPMDDPGEIVGCDSFADAFAAIAREEHTFLSRGDNSTVHTLEKKLWPAGTAFGDWYVPANLEMGPCLVMNDMLEGYVLTDKLTWLIFHAANGII